MRQLTITNQWLPLCYVRANDAKRKKRLVSFARYRSHRGTWRKGKSRKRKSGWHVVVR